MPSKSLVHLPALVDFRLDPSPPQMLSRKAHLLQPCWPRPIDFLMALREDSFVYLRSVMAVILLPVSRRVLVGLALVGLVLVLQKVQVDLVR
jgi:hypothetical protein|tara:strand:+ start:477 stop:752 length:276 start_codon:yes stop_codon:yes gene_type:complete